MRKVLVFFLVIFAANIVLSQSLRTKNTVVKSFDDTKVPSVVLSPNSYSPLPAIMFNPPVGAVPYKPFYVDYVTNGNSLNQVWISGSFILTAVNYCDSAEATNAAAGASARCLYNYSTDGGVTWASADGFSLGNGAKTRFPDMQLISGNPQIPLALSRLYDPGTSTNRFSGVAQDLFLGAEAADLTRVQGPETGLGYFGDMRMDGKFGGLFQSADTIYYSTYDASTKTFSGKKFLYRTANSNTVCSYMLQASKISNHMTAIWNFVNPDAGTLRPQQYTTSTDNGVTWSPVVDVMSNSFVNGDSANPYWHEDITYKPGTNVGYVVFPTRDVFASYTTTADLTKPWKIMMYKATGTPTPVVVADRHNIPFLSDTNQFNKFLKQSINASHLSHPTIGFSADGSSIFVAFSVVQTDTLLGYNFNDIYVTRSTDDGATWSTPKNVTNTPTVDEMYPTLERYNNGNNSCWLAYQVDEIPGSFTFTDAQIVSRTYQVLKNFGPVGVYETVGTEVPSAFSLKQNFPNPFNPTTKIRFDMSKAANVTLKVFDVAGKEIATLINNEFVTIGTQQVTFDASKLSTGIYFYTLTAGDFKETKKMMLVK